MQKETAKYELTRLWNRFLIHLAIIIGDIDKNMQFP